MRKTNLVRGAFVGFGAKAVSDKGTVSLRENCTGKAGRVRRMSINQYGSCASGEIGIGAGPEMGIIVIDQTCHIRTIDDCGRVEFFIDIRKV